MSTVLIRYSTPLAAFGHTARFDRRTTAATPTVSAIQGLFAAAVGVRRDQPWPDWVADLHLAIRVDYAGELLTDYHTVNQPPARRYAWLDGERRIAPKALKKGKVDTKDVKYDGDRGRSRVLANADGARATFNTYVTNRVYVADATYLIAVADPSGDASRALDHPKWAIYAGRKSCPLTEPVVLGRTEDSPDRAVAVVPTVAHPTERDLGETATRQVVQFVEPAAPDAVSEDRNDRGSGFRRHRLQRRWHTEAAVPVAADWFDVVDRLKDAGVTG